MLKLFDFNHKKNPVFFLSLTRALCLFILIIIVVFVLDIFLDHFLIGSLNSNQKIVTVPHFAWHFNKILSINSFHTFIEGIASQKKGLLGERYFYWVIVVLFAALTIGLFIGMFIDQDMNEEKKKNNDIMYSKKKTSCWEFC